MIKIQADHSKLLGPVRNQGLRPTCLAFAASAVNAAANVTGHLSVEYLCHHAAKLSDDWQPALGFTTDAVLGAVASPGQPAEEAYPYGPDADTPIRVPPANLAPLYSSTLGSRSLSCDDIVNHVEAGCVVGIVVAVTTSLFYPADGIIAFDPIVLPDMYHALVVVGSGSHAESGEKHLLIRNSWGEAWGCGGSAWMPRQHLELHMIESFVV